MFFTFVFFAAVAVGSLYYYNTQNIVMVMIDSDYGGYDSLGDLMATSDIFVEAVAASELETEILYDENEVPYDGYTVKEVIVTRIFTDAETDIKVGDTLTVFEPYFEINGILGKRYGVSRKGYLPLEEAVTYYLFLNRNDMLGSAEGEVVIEDEEVAMGFGGTTDEKLLSYLITGETDGKFVKMDMNDLNLAVANSDTEALQVGEVDDGYFELLKEVVEHVEVN